MKITVLSRSGDIVSFSSDAGHGSGMWVGAGPVESAEYFVEVDLSEPIDWASISTTTRVSMIEPEVEVGRVRIVGVVEDVDDELVVQLRVGDHLRLLLDTLGDPPLGIVGESIELRQVELTIFPMDY
jgi:hypothetical protein